jgi:hypothetical protein
MPGQRWPLAPCSGGFHDCPAHTALQAAETLARFHQEQAHKMPPGVVQDHHQDMARHCLADIDDIRGHLFAVVATVLRALDGTSISEPGADGTTWRLHVGYDLATGQVDQITLTDVHEAENLQRLAYRPGDIVLADRGYAYARHLRPVIDAGAHFIIRMGWNALRLSKPDGEPFDLFAVLAEQTSLEGEVAVCLDDGLAAKPLPLRLVIRRKSDEQAEAEKSA